MQYIFVEPNDKQPCYEFDLAVERMRAAVKAVDDLPFEFTICARADGMMIGAYDCDETIRRLQAFEAIGAHCVYAPMPPFFSQPQRIFQSVSS